MYPGTAHIGTRDPDKEGGISVAKKQNKQATAVTHVVRVLIVLALNTSLVLVLLGHRSPTVVRQSYLRGYPPSVLHQPARCPWSATRKLADHNSSTSFYINRFIAFLEHDIHGTLGYTYTLRDGSLLGAYRHGGLIPGDTDLDAVVLLPLNESVDELLRACTARLHSLGRPFDLQVVGSDPRRWLVMLPWAQPIGSLRPVVADLTVYSSARFLDRHATRAVGQVRDVFSNLCRCPFSHVDAQCFRRAPEYLAQVYGPNFAQPSKRHASQKQIFDY